MSACMLQSVWSNEKRELSHNLVVCVALERELTIGTVGKADTFCGLLAKFCSLKAKKIPVGRVVLGDWLGCYRAYNRVGLYLILGQRTGMFRSRSSWQQLL